MRDCREKFYELIKEKGYTSFRKFCAACEIAPGNLHNNLMRRDRIELPRIFKVANMLKVPVDTILNIFYEEEMMENSDIVANDGYLKNS